MPARLCWFHDDWHGATVTYYLPKHAVCLGPAWLYGVRDKKNISRKYGKYTNRTATVVRVQREIRARNEQELSENTSKMRKNEKSRKSEYKNKGSHRSHLVT